MSEGSDPTAISEALTAAIDAFNEEGYGLPTHEEAIDPDADWKTQLTKACRLLAAVEHIEEQGFYMATVELCFGATERSVEAFVLFEGGDDLNDFHDHAYCYERATALGLLSTAAKDDLRQLYDTNRTDSYYGGRRPTEKQALAMRTLSRSVHDHVRNQIREGGVCTALNGPDSDRTVVCVCAHEYGCTLITAAHKLRDMPLSIDDFESGDLPSGPSVPEQVIRYLLSNSDQAFTRAEIARAIEEAPNTVGTALSRLKDRDLVRHKGEYWAITDDTERVTGAYDLHSASQQLDAEDGGIDTEEWDDTAPDTAHPSERHGQE